MLEPPDVHFLLGASGWLELDLPAEADRELDRIAQPLRQHPDVLELRWQVRAALGDWAQAATVAEALVEADSQRPSGWIHRAYSLRRAPGGGLQRAWDALRPAYERFPTQPLIPYNLACYAAQFERLDEAWDWLQKAVNAAGNLESIKEMALADEDLKALHERIRGM